MIARRTPIVIWLKDSQNNERKITARVDDDLLISYTITSRSGTPLSAEYVHKDFYRNRPSVARDDWQNDLERLIASFTTVTILSTDIPK